MAATGHRRVLAVVVAAVGVCALIALGVTVQELNVVTREAWVAEAGELGRGRLPRAVMAAYDNDGDDAVSWEEFPGTVKSFDTFDRDDDGRISLEELLPVKSGAGSADRSRLPGRGFIKRHDQDGDKRLSRSELPEGGAAFHRLDVDGDRLLTALEVAFRPRGERKERRGSP